MHLIKQLWSLFNATESAVNNGLNFIVPARGYNFTEHPRDFTEGNGPKFHHYIRRDKWNKLPISTRISHLLPNASLT